MADEPKPKMQPVRAVQRAIKILQSFSKNNSAMTVSELQKHVRLSRPTLYRLLYTLQMSGLIKVSGSTQRYQLDYEVAKIAHAWFALLDVADIARPILTRLWENINETVALMIPEATSRVCVVEMPGRQTLSYSRGIGDVDHISATASGRAILAFLPEAAIEAALAEKGKDTKNYLRAELEKIRRNGFAVSGGSIAGIIGVAAPVFNDKGEVVASVAVTGPEARIGQDHLNGYVAAVRETAAEVSKAMGYRG